jgi:anti-sigma factor RsiW
MSDLGVPEIEDLLGAYALDAVDPEERELVERHLVDCPRCRAELAEHLEVAALIANVGAPAPEGLWTRIAESLEEPPPAMRLEIADRSEPDNVVDLASRRRSRWLAGLAAAAAVVVIGALGVVVLNQEQRIDELDRPELALDLSGQAGRALNDPVNSRTVLNDPAGATDLAATAVVTPTGNGFLVTPNLPSLPEDRTYQLWGVVNGSAISLGVLGPQPSVSAFHVDSGVRVEAFAITEEPAGGVVSSQNEPTLLGSA